VEKRTVQMYMDLKSPLIYYGVMLYLFSLVFDAPIRYVLYLGGIPYLIYLRDLFVVSVIVAYILKSLMCGKIHKILLITFFLIFYHSVIAIIYIKNILQVCFGIKVLMPIIIGMIAYPLFESRPKLNNIFLTFFLFIAILGVYLNTIKEFPWEGLAYEVAGKAVEGSRAWTTWGIKRIGGFSRASFDAAMQILVLGSYVITHLKIKWIMLPLWFLAGPAILITTTKGIFLIYVLFNLFLIIHKIVPNIYNYYQKSLILIVLTTIMLPVISYAYSERPGIFDVFKNILFVTFWKRIVDVWPDLFIFLERKGSILLGRGIGGVGVSQLYFEPEYYSAVDNLFLYALIWFGVASIIYLIYIYKMAQSIDLQTGLFYYFILITLFFYGITQNIFENGFLMIFFGICLRYLWIISSKSKPNYTLAKCEGG